jgi:hypothetical protein
VHGVGEHCNCCDVQTPSPTPVQALALSTHCCPCRVAWKFASVNVVVAERPNASLAVVV